MLTVGSPALFRMVVGILFFWGGGRTIKEDSLQVGLLTDFSPQQGPKDSRTKGGLDP